MIRMGKSIRHKWVKFHRLVHVDSKDSDHTERMSRLSRLIRVLAASKCRHIVDLSTSDMPYDNEYNG